MTQAVAENSTPMPGAEPGFIPSNHSVSSRRTILLGAAVSLPIAALAAVPATARTVSEQDPIFAAIERYKVAAKAEDDAEADFSRREKILLEKVGQREPSIGVFDLTNPRGPMYGHQCTAYSHEQIDALCPPDQFADMNNLYHAWFEELAKRDTEIMGDAEQVRQNLGVTSIEALADLVETVPTTLVGILALVDWQRETIDADSQALHAGHYSIICDTIGDALRELYAEA